MSAWYYKNAETFIYTLQQTMSVHGSKMTCKYSLRKISVTLE